MALVDLEARQDPHPKFLGCSYRDCDVKTAIRTGKPREPRIVKRHGKNLSNCLNGGQAASWLVGRSIVSLYSAQYPMDNFFDR